MSPRVRLWKHVNKKNEWLEVGGEKNEYEINVALAWLKFSVVLCVVHAYFV